MFNVVFCLADLHTAILDFDSLSWKSDNPFYVRDVFSGRNKDNDIASFEIAESRSDLVHDDKIVFFEGRSHAGPYDRIRIGDKKSDEKYDSSDKYQK